MEEDKNWGAHFHENPETRANKMSQGSRPGALISERWREEEDSVRTTEKEQSEVGKNAGKSVTTEIQQRWC